MKLFFNIGKIVCTKSHWKNCYNFIKTSKQGRLFIIYDNIHILRDRDSFILYLNKNINNNFKIKIRGTISKWYDTSFEVHHKNKFNNISIKISESALKDGLYVTHWKEGDIVEYNNMHKKISNMFIDNKISNYNKKYYPIIRNQHNKILWVPNIFNKSMNMCQKQLYLSWSNTFNE